MGDLLIPFKHGTSHKSDDTDPLPIATTSVRGTVELATSGENASNVVVQGNDSRLVSKVLAKFVADLTYSNSTTETDIVSYTVPANTLGTDKAIRVSLRGRYVNASGSNKTITIRIKYGATTLFQDSTIIFNSAATTSVFIQDFILTAKEATNSQIMIGSFIMGGRGTPAIGLGSMSIVTNSVSFGVQGSSSIDSTSAQDFKVTFQHSAAAENTTFTRDYAAVELLD